MSRLSKMASTVRIILVTKSGCGPCARFLATQWPDLKDNLSYAIGGKPIEHIDIAIDGQVKVPPAIRPHLKFVPQLFALYGDGVVEVTKNPINSPAGIEELKDWVEMGPPRFAASEDNTEEKQGNDTLEVVVVTKDGCVHCETWEASGGMDKFLQSVPSGVMKSRFNIRDGVPNPEDRARIMSLIGFGTPSVVVVKHDKWKNPVELNLQKKDVMLSPANVRAPGTQPTFNRWLTLLQDKKTPFLGYLLLATSSSCGVCRNWKQTGGMDKFISTYGSLPGILLSHNGLTPASIGSKITAVPSIFFVAANEWSMPQPELIVGPHPAQEAEVAAWIKEIQSGEGKWSNETDYVPETYQVATRLQASFSVRAPRRPLQRQKAR